ncbi:MAG TPA: hypothetical protein PLA74_11025 [Syntrophales bacterium]|nr:hypothetical protein [Syntrophales bacterium]
MGKQSNYEDTISRQYRELMEHCKGHLEKMDQTLPEPVEDFQTLLQERGISR